MRACNKHLAAGAVRMFPARVHATSISSLFQALAMREKLSVVLLMIVFSIAPGAGRAIRQPVRFG